MRSVLTLEFWQNLTWFNKESLALALLSGLLFVAGTRIYVLMENVARRIFSKKSAK